MSFLDRFKIQPKYKSADADVRAQAVAELGAGPLTDEDRAILVALANEDPDPRVRRAAAARIEDVGVLASMATRDADEEIRGELVNRLAGIAVGEDAEAATRAVSAMRVLMPPGWTVVTPMPYGSSSWRRTSLKPRIANLLEEYADWPAGPMRPNRLETLTTWPPSDSSSAGSRPRVRSTGAWKLIDMTQSNSSFVRSRKLPWVSSTPLDGPVVPDV